MEAEHIRRSDRISLQLPIRVSGTDTRGEAFIDSALTILLSRHGAKVLINRGLAPEQELTVQCLGTGKEADARVVGMVGNERNGQSYGIEFLDPVLNPWGIEFPPLSESKQAVMRVLLQCVQCKILKLTYLNELEAEFFEANQGISQYCKHCKAIGLWKQALAQAFCDRIPVPLLPEEPPESPATASLQRTQNERKEIRISLKLTACVRHPHLGEDIVFTEKVSRGGFSFRSRKHYAKGWLTEVAVPYSRGPVNIFIPARIVYAAAFPEEKQILYGVSYIPFHEGWPGTERFEFAS